MSLHLQVTHSTDALGRLLHGGPPATLLGLFTHTYLPPPPPWSLPNPAAWVALAPTSDATGYICSLILLKKTFGFFFLIVPFVAVILYPRAESKRGCLALTASCCKSCLPVLQAHHNISNQSSLKPQSPISRTARRNSCPSPRSF